MCRLFLKTLVNTPIKVVQTYQDLFQGSSMDHFDYENTGDLPPEEVEKIERTIESLGSLSRKLGLYVDRAMLTVVPGPGGFPQKAILVSYTIGDLAFADRVQNPEQDAFNKQFDELATNMVKDDFAQERERMKRNLEAGRDPLDDGE